MSDNGGAFAPFLASTAVIDWQHTEVRAKALELGAGNSDPVQVARSCFEWVRDAIRHSSDHGDSVVTCSASETLREGTGFCYAKSHLLAALLRANAIPAGLCYQRLSLDGDGPPYCLHGLNAVHLPGYGWYRIDARGNRSDVDARFDPPRERLAFAIVDPQEADLPEIWPTPLPGVVEVLQGSRDCHEVRENLPDLLILPRRIG